MILRAYCKETTRRFLYKITTKKEKSSDLIFLPQGRETILELFTVRIFVGCSQNASPGSFFSPIFCLFEFLSLFCCTVTVIFEWPASVLHLGWKLVKKKLSNLPKVWKLLRDIMVFCFLKSYFVFLCFKIQVSFSEHLTLSLWKVEFVFLFLEITALFKGR